MGALIEIVIDGFKEFGGQIIGGILFAVALGLFPSLKKFLGRKKDTSEEEIQKQLTKIEDTLKEVLKHHDESPQHTETQIAEETRQREEAQRQLEAMQRASNVPSSNRGGKKYRKAIIFAVTLTVVVCIYIGLKPFYDIDTQKELGDKYRNKDHARALYWYRKAAENGDADTQRLLASMYLWGGGVSRDETEATKWWTKATEQYSKAAEQGDAQAQFELGEMYDFPFWNMDTDLFLKATKWYRKAAEQGHAVAQYRLGNLYYFNFKNNSEAIKWYRLSAAQDDAEAQYSLGRMYYEGDGVKQDYNQAVEWYRKSAEQGNAIAQYDLGDMYENGYGVSKDLAEAEKWHEKALEQGYQPLIIKIVD